MWQRIKKVAEGSERLEDKVTMQEICKALLELKDEEWVEVEVPKTLKEVE